jgi:hypothetical protein
MLLNIVIWLLWENGSTQYFVFLSQGKKWLPNILFFLGSRFLKMQSLGVSFFSS